MMMAAAKQPCALQGRSDHGVTRIFRRNKDLIVSGSFKVYPREFEAAIDPINGIAKTFMIGVPHMRKVQKAALRERYATLFMPEPTPLVESVHP